MSPPLPNLFYNKIDPLVSSLPKEKQIFRIFFTSSNAYKKEKYELRVTDNDILNEVICTLHLPHYIWVCELSTPNLYKNKEVYAEFIFDATNKEKSSSLLFFRMENYLHLSSKDGNHKEVPGILKSWKNFQHNLGKS